MALQRVAALALALAVVGIAGCDDDATEPASTAALKIKQQLPALPIADEGSSTGVGLTDATGEEVFNQDAWKLPKGRTNELTDTITYDFGTADLEPGGYGIEGVFRACQASGCSEGSLGEPMAHCAADFTVQADKLNIITVVFKDRRGNSTCGFAYGTA